MFVGSFENVGLSLMQWSRGLFFLCGCGQWTGGNGFFFVFDDVGESGIVDAKALGSSQGCAIVYFSAALIAILCFLRVALVYWTFSGGIF